MRQLLRWVVTETTVDCEQCGATTDVPRAIARTGRYVCEACRAVTETASTAR